MFLLGVSYFSPSKIVETISKKFDLHLYRSKVKLTKQAEKKQQVEHLKQVASGNKIDEENPRFVLKEFLASRSEKPKILLVENLNSFFGIKNLFKRERNRRRMLGVVVFDNPSNLFDYRFQILDAERIRDGMWWKKKGFLEETLFREIKSHTDDSIKIHKIKKIKRKKHSNWVDNSARGRKPNISNGVPDQSGKVRGFIGQFIQAIKVHITDGKDKQYLQSLLGHMLGVESKNGYKTTMEKLTKKYDVPMKLLKSLESYAKTKGGSQLVSTFYFIQKGKSFRALQREYRFVPMDDWLIMQEYVSATAKHKFFRKPKVS